MTVRLVCALLVVLAAAPVVPAGAGDTPPPHPGVLWQQYPLGRDRLTGTTATTPSPARAAATTQAPAVPPSSGPAPLPASRTTGASGSSGLPIAPIALGAAAMLALAGLATLYARSRRVVVHREVALAGPLATITLAATRLESRRRERGIEGKLPEWSKFTSKRRRRGPVTDHLDERVDTEARQSHTDVGSRVADVIKAAEELAEQIRADAHHEAAQIKGQAEDAHAAAISELAGEQEALRAAAEAHAAEIRRTGESYATERRREAEAETGKLVAEAETQARAMREAAEQMAMRIETNALERREQLEQRTQVVETRLRRFQKGLGEISKDLEELLDPGRAQPETILEALDVDERSLSGQNADGGKRRG